MEKVKIIIEATKDGVIATGVGMSYEILGTLLAVTANKLNEYRLPGATNEELANSCRDDILSILNKLENVQQ